MLKGKLQLKKVERTIAEGDILSQKGFFLAVGRNSELIGQEIQENEELLEPSITTMDDVISSNEIDYHLLMQIAKKKIKEGDIVIIATTREGDLITNKGGKVIINEYIDFEKLTDEQIPVMKALQRFKGGKEVVEFLQKKGFCILSQSQMRSKFIQFGKELRTHDKLNHEQPRKVEESVDAFLSAQAWYGEEEVLEPKLKVVNASSNTREQVQQEPNLQTTEAE